MNDIKTIAQPHSIDVEDEEMQNCCGDDGTKQRLNSKSPGLLSEDETVVTAITTSSSIHSESSEDSTKSFDDHNEKGFHQHGDYFLKSTPPESSIGLQYNDAGDPPSNQEELILFGFDLSNLSSTYQFMISAFGVFFFTILYGYLQELIQIQIAGRQFALFLAACQFAGYAFWSAILSQLHTWRLRRKTNVSPHDQHQYHLVRKMDDQNQHQSKNSSKKTTTNPPFRAFLALAIMRAIDMGLTNLSMRYLNYPAKTLIKSSRVIFTMIMGVIIGKKKYSNVDYIMVVMLVCGLSLFLHADMTSNAVFHPVGVFMLVTSLSLDGSVTNWSEVLMRRHNLGQDEFQMKLYFFSFIIMFIAAYQIDELGSGIQFFFQTHGTMSEVQDPTNQHYTWSIRDKTCVLFLFCTLGIFGGSCACAITKRFGALAMAITTTTRKATTIFLSFALFPNACTFEHILGVSIFVIGLFLKGGLCNNCVVSTFCSWIQCLIPSNLFNNRNR